MTNFTKIDIAKWNRKEIFEFYQNSVPCSYSLTASLDLSNFLVRLKNKKYAFYPVFVWLLSTAFQNTPQFRYAYNDSKELVLYDRMHPNSAFLNKETELFGSIWTEYSDDLQIFLRRYEEDMQAYYPPTSFSPKPAPANCFHISNIPYFSFSSFHLHLPKGNEYLTPIFTMGKINADTNSLPLALQVHHSVCDGYHVGKFLSLLQTLLNDFQ